MPLLSFSICWPWNIPCKKKFTCLTSVNSRFGAMWCFGFLSYWYCFYRWFLCLNCRRISLPTMTIPCWTGWCRKAGFVGSTSPSSYFPQHQVPVFFMTLMFPRVFLVRFQRCFQHSPGWLCFWFPPQESANSASFFSLYYDFSQVILLNPVFWRWNYSSTIVITWHFWALFLQLSIAWLFLCRDSCYLHN